MSKKKTIKEDIIENVEKPTVPDFQEQEVIEVEEELKDNTNDVEVQEEDIPESAETHIVEGVLVVEQLDEDFANVKSHKGIVINTSKLNVRKLPSLESEIIDVIKKKDTLMINPSKSTATFYHVTLDNGLEGYCVRDYIVG